MSGCSGRWWSWRLRCGCCCCVTFYPLVCLPLVLPLMQVESMTTNPMAWEGAINPRVAENQCAQDCLLPMGELKQFGAVY